MGKILAFGWVICLAFSIIEASNSPVYATLFVGFSVMFVALEISKKNQK